MSSQHDLREALLVKAGETGHYTLDDEPTPLWINLISGTLLDLLTQMNAVNGTRHFINPADVRDDWYHYTTRNRQYKLGATGADASISSAVEHVVGMDGYRVSADTIINQQKAVVDPMTFPAPPIKVWEYNSTPPLPLTVVTGAPLTFQSSYADYVLDCHVEDYGPSDGIALVVASTGDAVTATLTHHGWTSDITLASAGTSTITALYVLGRETVRAPEVSDIENDLTSQALPRGLRAGPEISGALVGPEPAAIGIAKHLVWRYSEPKIRPTVTVFNWITSMFDIDLYDLIAYTGTQLKVSGKKFELVGLTETVERAATTGVLYTHQMTWQEQTAHSPFFKLNSSLLDGADELAY